MRITLALSAAALIATLAACDRQDTGIDPRAGLDCFEAHRATQPPGTQYEGIGSSSATRLTIRIMNGTGVVTVECSLNPDGSVARAGAP